MAVVTITSAGTYSVNAGDTFIIGPDVQGRVKFEAADGASKPVDFNIELNESPTHVDEVKIEIKGHNDLHPNISIADGYTGHDTEFDLKDASGSEIATGNDVIIGKLEASEDGKDITTVGTLDRDELAKLGTLEFDGNGGHDKVLPADEITLDLSWMTDAERAAFEQEVLDAGYVSDGSGGFFAPDPDGDGKSDVDHVDFKMDLDGSGSDDFELKLHHYEKINITSGDGDSPGLNGIVEGDNTANQIDLAYSGDPEGDRIDAGDAPDGSNDDVVDAGGGDDTVKSEQGNDTVYAGSGNDSVDGGAGDDVIFGDSNLPDGRFDGDRDDDDDDDHDDDHDDDDDDDDDDDEGLAAGDDTLIGGDGDDMIFGEAGDDSLEGGEGDDTLDGGVDDDTLIGGAGADSMTGGDDRDTFIIGSVSDANGDIIDGGAGGDDVDTLDLSGLGPFVKVGETTDADGNSTSGTINFLDSPGGSVIGTLTYSEIENIVPCFTPGTRIATPRGEVAVEDLREGDRVITRDNGLQEVRWVGTRTLGAADLMAAPHLRPVRICAGALGRGLPERDMLVSPQHRLLLTSERASLYFGEREVLAAARHLTAIEGIDKVRASGATYIHFMCDRHEVVLSDGAWTESFQPGEQVLDGMGDASREEIFTLFPDLRETAGIEAFHAARRSLKRHEARLLVG